MTRWLARGGMRNANAETLLTIYGERGRQESLLEDVYRQLFNPELYLRAYYRLAKNEGAMTRGATEETVDAMSTERIQGIIELLRHERYRWTPVRRTLIPKGNGKLRPLGIPSWSDKLLQEVMRSLLSAYYEPQFSRQLTRLPPRTRLPHRITRRVPLLDGNEMVHRR